MLRQRNGLEPLPHRSQRGLYRKRPVSDSGLPLARLPQQSEHKP